MQITIDSPPDLDQNLKRQAAQANIPLQALILEVLRREIETLPSTNSQWSEAILSYIGIPDFPTFESYRDELLLTTEPDLFGTDKA